MEVEEKEKPPPFRRQVSTLQRCICPDYPDFRFLKIVDDQNFKIYCSKCKTKFTSILSASRVVKRKAG